MRSKEPPARGTSFRASKQEAGPFRPASCARHGDLSTRLSAITPAPQRGEGVNGQAYSQSSYCRPFTSPPFLRRIVAEGGWASQGEIRRISENYSRWSPGRARHSVPALNGHSRDHAPPGEPQSDHDRNRPRPGGALLAHDPSQRARLHPHRQPSPARARLPPGGRE